MLSKDRTVHITCGDIAANSLKTCGVSGECLPWKDLYLVGPLPKCDEYQDFFVKRAEFIKDWTQLVDLPSAEEMAKSDQLSLEDTLSAKSIVFWVWPMLSNHLLLLCLLDWYSENNYQGELLWVDASKQLGRYDEEYIHSLIDTEKPISNEQLSYLKRLWNAIRQHSPAKLLEELEAQNECFPHLNQAMWRYLEELPSIANGLSCLQRKVLEAISEGWHSPREIYRYAHQDETYFIAGDWYFWYLISKMIDSEFPLISSGENTCFHFPPKNISKEFDSQHLSLTLIGRQVLAGERCHVSLNGNDRPWGGIELAQNNLWRYDPCHKKIVVVAE
jgi:hypothetical protein